MEAAKVCSLSPSNYVQPVLLTTQSFVLPPFPPIFPFSFVNHYLLNYPTWHTAVPSPSTLHIPDHGMGTVSGTLKGFDPLVNLVLDNTTEYLRGELFFFPFHIEHVPWTSASLVCLHPFAATRTSRQFDSANCRDVSGIYSCTAVFLSVLLFFFFFPFLPISSLLSLTFYIFKNPTLSTRMNDCCKDPEDPFRLSDETRTLGLSVCRGTQVVLICPMDGMEAIENPFLAEEE